MERRIEAWHAALAAAGPVLEVATSDDEYAVELRLQLPHDPHGLAARTFVRPVGLRNAEPLPVTEQASWQGLALHGLTPYLVLATTADVDGVELTRECVVLCAVDGAPQDRLRRLLRQMLARQQDILHYLTLLLGDVGAGDPFGDDSDEDDDNDGDPRRPRPPFRHSFSDLVLLEPLVRAAARGDGALDRAHQLLEDLRDDDGGLPKLEREFLDLWQIVWEATQS